MWRSNPPLYDAKGVGSKIKHLREKLGLTRQELALLLDNISQSQSSKPYWRSDYQTRAYQIEAWETGRHRCSSFVILQALKAIAMAYGIPFDLDHTQLPASSIRRYPGSIKDRKLTPGPYWPLRFQAHPTYGIQSVDLSLIREESFCEMCQHYARHTALTCVDSFLDYAGISLSDLSGSAEVPIRHLKAMRRGDLDVAPEYLQTYRDFVEDFTEFMESQ